MGNNCGAHTFLTSKAQNPSKIEHEATTSKIGEDQGIAINVEFQPRRQSL
jgi:Fe-S cluster assembly protein SufB